ncbi:protein VARIATION IN COMPOUND TRIGGERED ROOT growth response-like [Prosopis cineraria]|uniref:protein VARIATION IN COMPOUND TRIGGERED ROOT growth response-like n=1 Tax=Prosopis cineraria TaxID=364024 RepID=UPI00240FC5B1|nr:protein VARIATION IN COMPOUND TRIGGERED ROOT growth response-like [Prosopis cineraria]
MDPQSSVSSSSKRVWKYDVAISYNDMETDSVYRMLWSALGTKYFVRIGSRWVNPLEKIEESQIYVAVFSKSFVYSSRCLDTLAVMFECMKVPGHKFLPIFFNIDPSEVKTWLAPFQTLLERPDLVIQNCQVIINVLFGLYVVGCGSDSSYLISSHLYDLNQRNRDAEESCILCFQDVGSTFLEE